MFDSVSGRHQLVAIIIQNLFAYSFAKEAPAMQDFHFKLKKVVRKLNITSQKDGLTQKGPMRNIADGPMPIQNAQANFPFVSAIQIIVKKITDISGPDKTEWPTDTPYGQFVEAVQVYNPFDPDMTKERRKFV